MKREGEEGTEQVKEGEMGRWWVEGGGRKRAKAGEGGDGGGETEGPRVGWPRSPILSHLPVQPIIY